MYKQVQRAATDVYSIIFACYTFRFQCPHGEFQGEPRAHAIEINKKPIIYRVIFFFNHSAPFSYCPTVNLDIRIYSGLIKFFVNYPPQSGGLVDGSGRERRAGVVETHAGHRRRVAPDWPDHFDGAPVRARGRLPQNESPNLHQVIVTASQHRVSLAHAACRQSKHRAF